MTVRKYMSGAEMYAYLDKNGADIEAMLPEIFTCLTVTIDVESVKYLIEANLLTNSTHRIMIAEQAIKTNNTEIIHLMKPILTKEDMVALATPLIDSINNNNTYFIRYLDSLVSDDLVILMLKAAMTGDKIGLPVFLVEKGYPFDQILGRTFELKSVEYDIREIARNNNWKEEDPGDIPNHAALEEKFKQTYEKTLGSLESHLRSNLGLQK